MLGGDIVPAPLSCPYQQMLVVLLGKTHGDWRCGLVPFASSIWIPQVNWATGGLGVPIGFN